MARVYAIANETKEVVRILSVLMEDDPEQTPPPPRVIVAPTPQASQFDGLDLAFQPILERLLTRDAWPQSDFNALAREIGRAHV